VLADQPHQVALLAGVNLEFYVAHLNRLIPQFDAHMIYVTDRARRPGLVRISCWRALQRFYPQIPQDQEGMKRLLRQSLSGGNSSPVARKRRVRYTQGGDHGYSLSHASGGVRQPGPDRGLRDRRRRGGTGPLRPAGTPTNSSTRRTMARCCDPGT